jgi:inosose dehydratase
MTSTVEMVLASLSNARLGSAPDSWGVWFPASDKQTPASRFLDEIAAAGYQYLELGPWGYLPNDPSELRDELGSRGLTLSGGTVGGSLHNPDAWEAICAEARQVASLVTQLGAKHIVFLPGMYRDLMSGERLEPSQLDADAWKRLIERSNQLGDELASEFGARMVFHPHADSHVETQAQIERYLRDTDPAHVGLCLDTGHVTYCHGDNAAIVNRFPDRIEYVHFKQVDPDVLNTVGEQDLAFAAAVEIGVTCEPPKGVPTVESLAEAFTKLPDEVFVIVEQDLYPCSPDKPLPIGRRTQQFLRSCGIGAARG